MVLTQISLLITVKDGETREINLIPLGERSILSSPASNNGGQNGHGGGCSVTYHVVGQILSQKAIINVGLHRLPRNLQISELDVDETDLGFASVR